MISLFNTIIRRGHQPREPAIQRLMASLGLVVTYRAPDTATLDDNLEEAVSEDAESSVCTDDESVYDGEDGSLPYIDQFGNHLYSKISKTG